MQQDDLSNDVLVYLRRALPHVLAGKPIAESMAAVLDDDARLMNAAFKRATSDHFPTPDERGVSRMQPEQVGDMIFCEISRQVHSTSIAEQVPA